VWAEGLDGRERNQRGVEGGECVARGELVPADEDDGKVEAQDEQHDHPQFDVCHLAAVAEDLAGVVLGRPADSRDELESLVVGTIVDLDKVDGGSGGGDVLCSLGELPLLGLDGRVQEPADAPEDEAGRHTGGKHDKGELVGVDESDDHAGGEHQDIADEISQRLRCCRLQLPRLAIPMLAQLPKSRPSRVNDSR